MSPASPRRGERPHPGWIRVALGVLALLVVAYGCNRRRPIPRSPDAGPLVEVVDGGGRAVEVVAQPLLDEQEPDDDRDQAQPLEPGKGLRGSLAAHPDGKPDQDWYAYLVQLPTAQSGAEPTPQELAVELVPDGTADLALEVLDGEGRRMVLLDDKPAGGAERLPGLVVRLGQTLYLRVRASSRAPAMPPQAPYQLLLHQSAAPLGSEIEPNDTPEQAWEVAERDLFGQISWRTDQDWFSVPLPGPQNGVDAGVARGTILRLEILSPGMELAARLLAEGGAPLLEVRGRNGELRLRNVGLPEGTRRILLGLRAASVRRAGQGRYQVRVATEPALEGAEQEPNDRCEEATPLPHQRAGEVAGFLWPGDQDCFRLPLSVPSVVSLRLVGDCPAELVVPGEPRGPSLSLRRREDLLVRVAGRGGGVCFDAPYRLEYQVAPESP
ncbi:MAG: hypothetical protein RMK29_02155 [Myxococcales bacterium]|nr:hypothetical protein [Myxococcota bacterium]MDW8280483.1 hypothetical protein [Myxococcales bacterium]